MKKQSSSQNRITSYNVCYRKVLRVSYEDAREYKIDDLLLPSTGVPVDIKVVQWKAPLSCEVRAYPYTQTKAFHICSFEPKFV